MVTKLLRNAVIMLAGFALAAHLSSSANAEGSDANGVVHQVSSALKPKCSGPRATAYRGSTIETGPASFPASDPVEEIEFVCIRNSFLERQVDLCIADDVHTNGEPLECKDFPILNPGEEAPTKARNGRKPVLWMVTPVVTKTRRKIDYPDGSLDVVGKATVRSRPIVRVNVLALDLRNDSCALGSFDAMAREARFELQLSGFVIKHDIVQGVPQGKEESRVQVKLSDIHAGAGSTLTAVDPQHCPSLLRDFKEVQRRWTSSGKVAIENIGRAIHSPIPEIESVVHIRDGYGSYGSGFYIEDTIDSDNEANGSTLVLTNYHVVRDAGNRALRLSTLSTETVLRFLSGTSMHDAYEGYFPGVVVFYDERRDLALVRVPSSNSGPPLKLHDDDPMPPGIHEVVALGHPEAVYFYATKGIIGRFETDCKLERPEEKAHLGDTPLKCIRHDAALNPGNSGGPLLLMEADQEKRVLGVNQGVLAVEGIILTEEILDWLQHVGTGQGEKRPHPDLSRATVPRAGLSKAIHYAEIHAFLDEFAESRSSMSEAR